MFTLVPSWPTGAVRLSYTYGSHFWEQDTLARPQKAAQYEEADGIRQAAFSFHGLINGHGFVYGNKWAAFLSLGWFLEQEGLGEIEASTREIVAMCLKAAEGQMNLDAIEKWLRRHIKL